MKTARLSKRETDKLIAALIADAPHALILALIHCRAAA
jgi:hypothetical protein